MTIYVNEVEAFWIAINVTTFVLTLFAVWDALTARRIVKQLNGHAREIAANGNVRREAVRLVIQTLLLIAVIDGLFTDYPPVLTLPIIALILVPVALLVNSTLDTTDRRRLIGTVESAMATERDKAIDRIESKVDEAAAIVLSDRTATADALVAADRIESKVDDTAHKVQDIHDVTVDGTR